jgi:enoyl-CoA hydratase
MLPALRAAGMRTALPRFPRQPVVRWQASAAASHGEYTSILVSQPAPGVSQITLNRPKALNGAFCVVSLIL